MMKGLLTKEILVLLKNSRMQLMIMLLFAAVGTVSNNLTFIMIVPLLFSMVVISGMNVDETSRWQRYSICLPVSRKKIVSSKYLLILCAALISGIITSVFFLIIRTNNDNIPAYFMILASAAAGIIIPSFMLPFYFKFGAAKGWIVNFLVTMVAVMSVSVFFAAGFGPEDLSAVKDVLSDKAFPVIILAAAAAVFGISWAVSVKIYDSIEI